LAEKLRAFGCAVHEVDGHDHAQLLAALQEINSDKPTVVVAHTIKGKGISFMENRVEWHYKNPNEAQLAEALAELERFYA